MQDSKKELTVDQQIRDCLRQYYQFENVVLTSEKSGMNNITRLVAYSGKRYNVRVYCNHSDIDKVKFEHLILKKLSAQHLPIQIPIPVATVYNTTVSTLQDGRLVSLYHYIEGTQATSSELYLSLINATAHLAKALSAIKVPESPGYSPYYDLALNYPQFSNEQLVLLCENSKRLKPLQFKLIQLNECRANLERMREQFTQLPHSLIHGDINFSNSVAVNKKIIALLDFEFITLDLRAMELAVVLVDYFKPYTGYSKQIEWNELIEKYCHIHLLTDEEIRLLPKLVLLRAVDVAFHFLSRFTEGQDDEFILEKIVNESYSVFETIENNGL